MPKRTSLPRPPGLSAFCPFQPVAAQAHVLRPVEVVVGRHEQLVEDALDVLANVSGLPPRGERWRAGLG